MFVQDNDKHDILLTFNDKQLKLNIVLKHTFSFTIPVSLIDTSHNVLGSAIIFLHHTVSKLALIAYRFPEIILIHDTFPNTSKSISVVGAMFIPIGCVKYNALLSLFCIVVTFDVGNPP